MSKRDFFFLFYQAWQASFKKTMILKAFEATGLLLFNPEVILKKFNTSPSSSNSKSSALSASDWRKIRQLVDCIVNNRDQIKISKLNQTIHRLSVRATLAEHETKGLQEALVNERTCQKQGKPLLLKEPEEYHGRAVFWSTRKVKKCQI
jgi:hypothetical protein